MVKNSFIVNYLIVYCKTDDIYQYITEDVETRFGASNCELNWSLPKRNNKKVIGFMKDESGGKIMKEMCALRAKTYSYVNGNNDEDKHKKVSQKKSNSMIIKIV